MTDSSDVGGRPLSAKERLLSVQVIERWFAAGQLIFYRRPNYVTTATVLMVPVTMVLGSIAAPPAESQLVGAIVMFVIIALAALVYAGKELGRLRGGNRILLTNAAFIEERKYLWGRAVEISVPWDQVEAEQKTVKDVGIIMTVGAILFSTHEKLTVRNATTKAHYTYRPRTIQHYAEMRAAIIARVGLKIENEVWKIEVG